MEPFFIVAGKMRREFLLPPSGVPLVDVPGGNVLYAAGGLGLWDSRIGLLARIGEDYPQDWLRTLEKLGWDAGGVHILPEALDLRYFRAWTDPYHMEVNNPLAHFARLGMTFPKALLGYQPPAEAEDDRKTIQTASPRPADMPAEYAAAHTAHICPLDYATTCRLLSSFREQNITSLTMDPSAGYMIASAFEDVRSLIQGVTAFLTSEEKLRTLFWGRTDDLWQMTEALGSFGCELIVIKRAARGQMLYDAASKKRWEIPAYPARVFDLSGAGDSFCGGFAAGYQKTYDPVQAVLYGGVSASLTIEGSGALHILDTLPGLAQARLDNLSRLVREV